MSIIRIVGGRVIDPLRKLDKVSNVVVYKDLIGTDTQQDNDLDMTVIDADGLIVTPGWIDAHLHAYPLLPTGIPAEAVCFATGVTSAVDAGSSGCGTYPLYRPFLQMNRLNIKAFLNVATAGIIDHPLPENVNPAAMDPIRIRDVVQACPEIIGLKIRCSRSIVGEYGLKPLERCLEIAEHIKLPVMVHPTDPPCRMEEITERLRPGDILSHVFHNIGPCILDESGHVSAGIWKARERGILFDAANDRRHFGFSTAIPALKDHFYPDFISSDLTGMDMYQYPTAFSLPMLASKYLNMGMNIIDILDRVILFPAQLMGISEDAATLRAGSTADISIFRIEEKSVPFGDRNFSDPACRLIRGSQVVKPLLTICKGQIVFRDISV